MRGRYRLMGRIRQPNSKWIHGYRDYQPPALRAFRQEVAGGSLLSGDSNVFHLQFLIAAALGPVSLS